MIERKNLRIIFMGTPEFAVGSLERMVANGYNVVAVVTQPDRPIGRHGSILQPSPVKQFALSKGIPVLQPERMKDDNFISQLSAYQADLQVVVAFRMLPEAVWSMPRFGTFNVHASLLPQYRGAAPINWAVINGERRTGVTTFFLDEHIDTGRIILQRSFDIPEDADVEYVYNGLMALGAQACTDTIDLLLQGDGAVESIPQPQSTQLKAAPKIFKETCEINWNLPAVQIHNFIRGLSPSPGAWCTFGNSTLKIFQSALTGHPCNNAERGEHTAPGTFKSESHKLLVSTSDEWLEIKSLQLAGKKRIDARSFLNGRPL